MPLDRREASILLKAGQPRFDLDIPYKPGFIAELKHIIPKEHRAWNPATKRWEVDRVHLELVKKTLAEFFEYTQEVLV